MLQNKINKLIPFVSENFITYNLFEEGNYTPFVNVWKICDTEEEYLELVENLKNILYVEHNYDYQFDIELKYPRTKIYEITIYPNYDYNDDGGFSYFKENWSIEEIVDILLKIVK